MSMVFVDITMAVMNTMRASITFLMVLSIIGSRPCACALQGLLTPDDGHDCCHSDTHKAPAESSRECVDCASNLTFGGSPAGCGGQIVQPAIVNRDDHMGQLAPPVGVATLPADQHQLAPPCPLLGALFPARVRVLSTVMLC